MDAVTRVPAPRNEPVLDYAPGSRRARRARARLTELAGEPVELTVHDRRRAADGRRRALRRRRSRTGTPPSSARSAHATARRRARTPSRAPREAAPGWRGAVLRRPRRGLPQGRRPAGRPVAADAQRRHHARPVARPRYQAEIDAACELIDFWRFNVHFARQILAEQPVSSPGRLEPDRPPPARGLRLRDHAVQLHRDRRQPAHRARADGQHRGVEAVADPAVRRALR